MFSDASPSYEIFPSSLPDSDLCHCAHTVVYPAQHRVRPASRHPRARRRRPPRLRPPLPPSWRHRNPRGPRSAHARHAARALHHASRFAARLCAGDGGGRRAAPSRARAPQAADDFSARRGADGTIARSVRFAVWRWRCARSGARTAAGFRKVSCPAAVAPCALRAGVRAVRARAQVRVQVADAGKVVVGWRPVTLEGFRRVYPVHGSTDRPIVIDALRRSDVRPARRKTVWSYGG